MKKSVLRKLSAFGKQTLVDLQTKLDSVRREVRNLTVMGMDPGQTLDQADLIKELERSARAEMRLRTMALAYAKSNCEREIRKAKTVNAHNRDVPRKAK